MDTRLTNYRKDTASGSDLARRCRVGFLLVVAGLGGVLYGIDIGIISGALVYLSKTIDLTVEKTSIIVAAVLGGSMFSSLIAGYLADRIGRKQMIAASGFTFSLSIVLIVLAHDFTFLLIGRILQGLSGGLIAVVVPLYLAETLPAKVRGRGTAVFQLLLTLGILAAALIGFLYSRQAEIVIRASHGDSELIRAAEEHAWRGMFLSVLYPGVAFFACSFLLSESPRWLFGRGREDQALATLKLTLDHEEAKRDFSEMQQKRSRPRSDSQALGDSLLSRKYVLPFALACIILMCNQATGINSILGYLVVIGRGAGLSALQASKVDVIVKILNSVMTVVALALVDRKGRRFLLLTGTTGLSIALFVAAFSFQSFESKRQDVTARLRQLTTNNAITISPRGLTAQPSTLTLLYDAGDGPKLVSTATADDTSLSLSVTANKGNGHLTILKATLTPEPKPWAGILVAVGLCIFIASFSVGPGVIVWLALSELLPTRIRSNGMGIALLLNQGVSTAIAAVFLPEVAAHGYSSLFFAWGSCAIVYFLVTLFFLPETAGKSLEEVEASFT